MSSLPRRSVFALVAAACISAVSHGSDARAEPAAPPAVAAAGLDPKVGAALPLSTRFRTSSGSSVALGDVLGGGRPALLVLAYNRCNLLCSLVLRSVTRVVPALGLRPGDDYSLVTLSIDPSETIFEASRLQAALIDAAGFAGQTSRWTFLVGERPAIDAVAEAIGFRYAWDPETQQYAHPAALITISARGTVTGYFDGLDPNAPGVRAALLGAPATESVLARTLASCFRFDTAHSRYGGLLVVLLRALAASLSLGLILVVWRLARASRSQTLGGRS